MTEAEERYADIIDLPHVRPTRHVPMPLSERAAQFASFAALTAHSDSIREVQQEEENA